MNLKKNIYPCLIYVFTIIILFSTVVIPENAYAQNGVYDWLNAETHSPEYDFSNKNLAFYAKDDNLSLNNKGFLVFDGNTLSVKKRSFCFDWRRKLSGRLLRTVRRHAFF